MVNYKKHLKQKEKKKDNLKYVDEPKTTVDFITNTIIEAQGFRDKLNNFLRRITAMKKTETIKEATIGYANRTQWHIRNMLGLLYRLVELELEGDNKNAIHNEKEKGSSKRKD